MPQLINSKTPVVTVSVPVPVPTPRPAAQRQTSASLGSTPTTSRPPKIARRVPQAFVLPHEVDSRDRSSQKFGRVKKKKYGRYPDTLGHEIAASYLKSLPSGELRSAAQKELKKNLANLTHIADVTAGKNRAESREAIRQLWGQIGAELPEGRHFDPQSGKPAGSKETSMALRSYMLAGGESREPRRMLIDADYPEARVVRAIIESTPLIHHQLLKGYDESGIDFYDDDIYRMNAGLIKLYGRRLPDGGYTSQFGKIDKDHKIIEKTPHLDLFHALVGFTSAGETPQNNLNIALHAYETARRQSESGSFFRGHNPFSILPPNKGVERTTGEYHHDFPYLDNERSEDYGINEFGKKNTKYLAMKMHILSYIEATKIMQKLFHDFSGDESKVARFIFDKQPVESLAKYKDESSLHRSLPMPSYPIRRFDDRKGETYHGAMLFGPKHGPFMLNLHGTPEALTIDLWMSRLWNIIMGDILNAKGKLMDSPRTPRERRAIMDSLNELAKHYNATPAEVQSLAWHGIQSLFRAMTAKASSFSFGDTINEHLAGKYPLTRHLAEGKSTLPERMPPYPGHKRRMSIIRKAKSQPIKMSRQTLESIPDYVLPSYIRISADDFFRILKDRAERLVQRGRMPPPDHIVRQLIKTADRVAEKLSKPTRWQTIFANLKSS